MGLFGRLLIEAAREHGYGFARNRRIPIEVHDFGEGLVEVVVGDADGSGTVPAIQVELTHELLENPAAIALSAREAERVIKTLQIAVDDIQPHERIKQQRRRRPRA